MSKLHNTPIKTLRYYDEIGLFKPVEVNKDNGYRYYSIEQFEQLNTINLLPSLLIPVFYYLPFVNKIINNIAGLFN